MKKIKLLLIAFSVFALNSCKDLVEAPQTPFATFSENSDSFDVEAGGQATKEYTIYTANVSDTERAITISVVADETDADPASYIVPTTLTIPAGSNTGTFSVTIKDINIGNTGKTLVIMLEQTENLFTGDNLTINVTRVCPWDEVFLTINFDDFAAETGFTITGSSGVVVDVPQGTWTNGDSMYSTKFCLGPGTYTFEITDSFGDGICCAYGSGSYSLTQGATTLASGGQFGASESTTFTLQ